MACRSCDVETAESVAIDLEWQQRRSSGWNVAHAQAGLLSNLVLNVWPPVLKMPLKTDERKAKRILCVSVLAEAVQALLSSTGVRHGSSQTTVFR